MKKKSQVSKCFLMTLKLFCGVRLFYNKYESSLYKRDMDNIAIEVVRSNHEYKTWNSLSYPFPDLTLPPDDAAL